MMTHQKNFQVVKYFQVRGAPVTAVCKNGKCCNLPETERGQGPLPYLKIFPTLKNLSSANQDRV